MFDYHCSNSLENSVSAAEYRKQREKIRKASIIARERGRRRTLPRVTVESDDLLGSTERPADTYATIGFAGERDAMSTGSEVESKLRANHGDYSEERPSNCVADDYHMIPKISSDDILQRRNKSGRVMLNVGGQRHEVLWSTLDRIPNTRLGRLHSQTTHDAIMKICDDYDILRNEYFFDRHPTAFATIIDFYRTGKLHLMDDICTMSYGDELEFWGIEEYYLEPCCLNKFNLRKDQVLEEMRKEKEYMNSDALEVFGDNRYNLARKFVWNLLEKPDSSKAAKVSLLETFLVVCRTKYCI